MVAAIINRWRERRRAAFTWSTRLQAIVTLAAIKRLLPIQQQVIRGQLVKDKLHIHVVSSGLGVGAPFVSTLQQFIAKLTGQTWY